MRIGVGADKVPHSSSPWKGSIIERPKAVLDTTNRSERRFILDTPLLQDAANAFYQIPYLRRHQIYQNVQLASIVMLDVESPFLN